MCGLGLGAFLGASLAMTAGGLLVLAYAIQNGGDS